MPVGDTAVPYGQLDPTPIKSFSDEETPRARKKLKTSPRSPSPSRWRPKASEGAGFNHDRPVALEDFAVLRFGSVLGILGQPQPAVLPTDMTTPPPKPPRNPARTRRLALLRRQKGITMIIALGVMLVTSLLVIAALTSARSEIHLTGADTSQKKAYYAAVAGVQDYEYHLTQDGDYLSYCTEPPVANLALNQYYKEGSEEVPMKGSELKAVEVPSTKEHVKTEESYAIQLIPAESARTKRKGANAKKTWWKRWSKRKGPPRGPSGSCPPASPAVNSARSWPPSGTPTSSATCGTACTKPAIRPSTAKFPPASPRPTGTECGHFYGSPAGPVRPLQQLLHLRRIGQRPDAHRGPRRRLRQPRLRPDLDDRIEFGNGGNEDGRRLLRREDRGEAGKPRRSTATTYYLSKVQSIDAAAGRRRTRAHRRTGYKYQGKTELTWKAPP